MTLSRPRLVLLPGDTPVEPGLVKRLEAEFEVIQLTVTAALEQMTREDPRTLLVLPPQMLRELQDKISPAESATVILQHIGEGVAVVDAEGAIIWQNTRLGEYDEEIRERFADMCRRAIGVFNQAANPQTPIERRSSKKYSFRCGDRHFELVTSPASAQPDEPHHVTAVVGVLCDVTSGRRILEKLDAIDAAGSELMKIEADTIAKLTMLERLTLLEEKIVRFVHDLLHFDDFEIRLLDRETDRLELVMAVGITPERIGEVIYPKTEGSGISGFVAATGESYLCADVKNDPLYREGLDDAASSLTVPLRLHDRIIGVFNVESKTPNSFDENDRQFATIFGRYIAMAMNILNLLVVERYTTNEEVATNVLGELGDPLADITEQAKILREANLADGQTRTGLDQIIESVDKIRGRIENCMRGPRTILGAEQELHRDQPDPEMTGKRILICDDDLEIRSTVSAILAHRGCDVTVCEGGAKTIETLQNCPPDSQFDLIISDIKMPDRSGYEVFRASKEISPTTPVILMTGFGYDPHHSIVRASQEGLHSFLFKPFKANQLIEETRKALAGKGN